MTSVEQVLADPTNYLSGLYPPIVIVSFVVFVYYGHWYWHLRRNKYVGRLSLLLLAISISCFGMAVDHLLRFSLFIYWDSRFILDWPLLLERTAFKLFYFVGFFLLLLTYLRIRSSMTNKMVIATISIWVVATIVGYLTSLAVVHQIRLMNG